jgi:hypothetical protein
VIVACLATTLAAAGSGLGLWRQFVGAPPDVRLAFLGDNIELRLDAATGLLAFDCWLVAENAGGADAVLDARASLKTASGRTVVFRKIDLREQGSGDSLPSFRALAGKAIQVRVTLTISELDAARQRTLHEGELHTIVLDIKDPFSDLRKTMTNCFWYGGNVAGELASNGSAPITRDDRCAGS